MLCSCGNSAGGDSSPPPPRAPGLYVGSETTPRADTATLASALGWLNTQATSGGVYLVVVDKDESLGPTNLQYPDKQVKITLEGEGGTRTIQLTGQGILFTVREGVTLKLGQGITLKGINGNNLELVLVEAFGKVEIAAGATLTGNKNPSTSVGGIRAASSASLEITGGVVEGNQGRFGAGVRIDASATLLMTAGEIRNNLAADDQAMVGGGGGIQIRGTVTLKGGRITGNIASGTDDSYGGGIGVLEGHLIVDGAEISGNTAGAKGGGGIYIWNAGSVTFKNGTITNNTTTAAYGSASSFNMRKGPTANFYNQSAKTCNESTGFFLE